MTKREYLYHLMNVCIGELIKEAVHECDAPIITEKDIMNVKEIKLADFHISNTMH